MLTLETHSKQYQSPSGMFSIFGCGINKYTLKWQKKRKETDRYTDRSRQVDRQTDRQETDTDR